MASTLETLAIKIVGDIADFESKMNTANKQADTFGGKMQEVGGGLSKFGVGLTAGVTTPIVGMGIKAISAASDLNESLSKVDAVFGKNAASVQKWSEGSATAFGMSRQSTLEAVGTYGNLFTAMGIGVNKSTDMSESLVGLAADLASFNNIDPTVALEKLRAGITGESEPLKTLGVNLTEATIQAKAMQMGLAPASVDMGKLQIATDKVSLAQQKAAVALAKYGVDSTQYKSAAIGVETAQNGVEKAMAGSKVTLDAAAKAQAAYKLIMEQTTTAQGDQDKTSGQLAGSLRIVKAQFEDVAAQLGQVLLPYAIQAVHWVQEMIAKFQGLSPETQKWIVIIAGAAAAIGPVLVVIGTLITAIGTIIGAFSAVAGAVSAAIGVFGGLSGVISAVGVVIAAIGWPITLIIAAVALLAAAWYNNWGGIREKTAAAWEFIKGAVTAGWNAIQSLLSGGLPALAAMMSAAWEGIKSAASSAWEGVKSSVSSAWSSIKGLLESGAASTTSTMSAAWTAIKSAAVSSWDGIKSAISSAWSAIRSLLDSGASAITSAMSAAWNAIKSAASSAWDGIKSTIVNAWNGIKSAITGGIDAIRSAVQSGMSAVQGIFSSVWNSIKSQIDNVLNSIKGAFSIDWGALGRGIIDGIARGISAGATAIADAAKNAANAALGAAKAALGIASPSRKGIEIGENFTGSMSAGAKRGLANLSATVTDGLNVAIGSISPRVSLAGAGGLGGGNVTINIPMTFLGNPDRQEVAAGIRNGLDDILTGLRQVGLR